MRKIEMDGEIYYENKGKFLNSSFIEVDLETKSKIARQQFSNIDYRVLEIYELGRFAKKVKDAGLLGLCIDVCEYGLEKYGTDDNFVKGILPIVTSVYRMLGKPGKAVEIAEKYMKLCWCESIALMTSLAAACCDIKQYERAKQYADIAYAKQGGGVGYTNELSLVYKRIKKELGDKYV